MISEDTLFKSCIDIKNQGGEVFILWKEEILQIVLIMRIIDLHGREFLKSISDFYENVHNGFMIQQVKIDGIDALEC